MADQDVNQYSNNGGFGAPTSYAQSTSGNYRMDPKTGQYAPFGSTAPPPVNNPYSQLGPMVQSLMKGYLRKQDTPGSYIPLTSTAPQNALQGFAPLDKYRTFGVPYTGYQYGQPQGQSGDPNSGLFGSPGGGGYGSGGY